ncbi:MAG: Uma2 family endonuclease [Panacagrimonas sp.]
MTSLLKPQHEFSFHDYLAWEQKQEERYEYVSGLVYCMSGGTQAHSQITGNAYVALRQRYAPHCHTHSQALKVKLRILGEDIGYYPDVLVTCRPGTPDALYNEHPCIVVEVLSPSTERVDLREKRFAYCALPGMHTYLVLDSGKPEARVFRRSLEFVAERYAGFETRIPVECGADTPVPGVQWLTLAELYEGAL